jgi:hypothetical protein
MRQARIEEIPMALTVVPDYFQEETEDALREQAEWLVREVGVDDSFFAHLLRTDAATFAAWRASLATLPPEDEGVLHSLWHTTLHLLSFLGSREDSLRDLFQRSLPAPGPGRESPLAPPWSGFTLKSFLETGGVEAIDQVDHWVTGLRFGDHYRG